MFFLLAMQRVATKTFKFQALEQPCISDASLSISIVFPSRPEVPFFVWGCSDPSPNDQWPSRNVVPHVLCDWTRHLTTTRCIQADPKSTTKYLMRFWQVFKTYVYMCMCACIYIYNTVYIYRTCMYVYTFLSKYIYVKSIHPSHNRGPPSRSPWAFSSCCARSFGRFLWKKPSKLYDLIWHNDIKVTSLKISKDPLKPVKIDSSFLVSCYKRYTVLQ